MRDHRSIPRLTRRQVLGGAALGATAPAWLAALPGWRLNSASATEPGELAIAWNAPPPDFNPLTAVSRSQLWFFNSVMSSLVKPSPADQSFTPDLAESWEISEDGSAYTFKLRENAAWHDGTPVTANDVAFTFTLALDPDTLSKLSGKLSLIKGAAAYTAKEATEVPGIVVVDDYTITFEQEFPNGLFIYEAILPILPQHILGEIAPADLATNEFFNQAPVGSGPFKFVEYRPDQFIEVEANPDYHLGAPAVNRIVYNIISSPDTIQVALGRDEIDMPVFDGGTATMALYESSITDERFRIDATAGSSVTGYGWNFRDEALADPRVHQALMYAINRPALVSAFNASNGTIYNSFMTHAWYQKPEWADLYQFDPDKAKALLEEAGWDSGRTVNVNVITLANEDIRAMVAAEQQMLADVGFNIQFQEMEAAVWVERFYTTHDFELVRVTFGVFPDPDGFLNFHLSTGSQNAFGYANPELDAKIEEARRVVDQEARIPLYQALNEEMLQSLPVCPLFMENVWWVRNKKWSVPLLDDLPEATSLETIPVLPMISTTQDVWGYHMEAWTKA